MEVEGKGVEVEDDMKVEKGVADIEWMVVEIEEEVFGVY